MKTTRFRAFSRNPIDAAFSPRRARDWAPTASEAIFGYSVNSPSARLYVTIVAYT